MDILYIFLGLLLLFFGGEWLVRGSVDLAKRLGISTLLVSLVIVGFGTSAPELLVCIQAALAGAQDIALGNVVGSNMANTLLILGVGGIIAPLACGNKVIQRDAIAVIFASILLVILSFFDVLDWRAGCLMIVALSMYLYMAYHLEKTSSVAEKLDSMIIGGTTDIDASEVASVSVNLTLNDEEANDKSLTVFRACLFAVSGIVLLVGGANFLVTGASAVARSFGISEAIIGLSLVAIGTSLPELATAIVASIKKQSDVIIGNVLGSNLFNILSILGFTALVSPLQMTGRIAEMDVWLMLASALLLYPMMRSGRVISRAEASVLLGLYTIYIVMMFVF